MTQILRSTPATLELLVYTAGVPTDLDATPTIAITDGNGAVVVTGAVSHPSVGTYRSNLPAQSDLKVLRAVWSGLLGGQATAFTQNYEIVGNLLFTEAEARSAPIVGQIPALADETKYPDAHIARWRSVIAELLEHRMNRGVVRRYCRAKFGGNYQPIDLAGGYTTLADGTQITRPGRRWDISRVISITHDGDPVAPGDIELVGSKIYWPGGTFTPAGSDEMPLNTTIEFEYGPDPVWAETHQRALDLLLANAAAKGFPSSATSVSTEDGTFRITNFPVAVEEFLKRHNYRV